MNVIVCTKQIPNPDAPVAFDLTDMRLVRTTPFILDESDSYGVEMALRLVEQSGGGEVSLVSVAPDEQRNGLQTALAMGAARAFLVSDPALAGLDALSTAKVLAAVVKRSGADLVVTATESTDGYTGTVPVQLAELLGFPSVSFANHVEVQGDALFVRRQSEAGHDEVKCPLPAVIAVTAGVVEVRYPSFKGIMSAKTKPIDVLSLADLGLDPADLGAAGARQEVVAIEQAAVRSAGEIITDEGDAHERIIAALESWKVI